MRLSSVDISGVGKYRAVAMWRFLAGQGGYGFSFGGLTVALWVSDRPRQNPQPWPVILLGLPLGTVRGLAQKL